MPILTVLPSPPSTSDPANFSAKADAHILALQTFTTEINAFGAELAGAGVITPTRDSIVANATTTDLWTHSKIQDWTGTPAITDVPDAPSPGSQRTVYPAPGTVFTNNANISVQGNANYTIASGDEVTITAVTVSTFYASIKRKDGLPVITPQSVLPGTRISYTGASAPAGYLACPTAQTNISRTTYAALFAAIGTTWGAGDGSTTFGMPWYPADYSPVQANSNVGTNSAGQVINHTHTLSLVPMVGTSPGSGSMQSGGPGAVTLTTSNPSGGGAANLAAGVRELFCVKY